MTHDASSPPHERVFLSFHLNHCFQIPLDKSCPCRIFAFHVFKVDFKRLFDIFTHSKHPSVLCENFLITPIDFSSIYIRCIFQYLNIVVLYHTSSYKSKTLKIEVHYFFSPSKKRNIK